VLYKVISHASKPNMAGKINSKILAGKANDRGKLQQTIVLVILQEGNQVSTPERGGAFDCLAPCTLHAQLCNTLLFLTTSNATLPPTCAFFIAVMGVGIGRWLIVHRPAVLVCILEHGQSPT
jgi:hypothetical protein